MAKQNVTFIERHLEKIVAGIAGAVLLFVLVTTVVLNPHSVEVGGDSLGPGQLYTTLADAAERARDRMKQPPRPDDSSEVALQNDWRDRLEKSRQQPPLSLPVVAVPLNPPLPEVGGGPPPLVPTGKVDLVEILPPTQPQVATGRAAARLPFERTVQIGITSDGGTTQSLKTTADYHWVVGAAAISRKMQRELFASAGYLSDRHELIVAEVRVQRREQGSNGLWSEPVVVPAFRPERYSVKPTVDLIPDGPGYLLTPDDDSYITALRQALDGADKQATVLRPVFQEFLADPDPQEDDRFEWTVPPMLRAPDGSEIDMKRSEVGVVFREDESGPGALAGEPGQPGAGRGAGGRPAVPRPPAADPARGAGGPGAVMARTREKLSKAKDAIAKKQWLEAKALLDEVRSDREVQATQRKEADDLYAAHRTAFELAADRETLTTGEQSTARLGPDVEPIWFTDIGVQPGKTYQYRVSLVAVNQYAGMASRLKNSQDARKLLLQGQWSAWSEPINVLAAKHLFVTAVPPDGGRVGIHLYEWSGGKWENAQHSVAPGEVATATKGRTTLDYGAVLVSSDPSRPFERRTGAGRGDGFKYKTETTGVAVLVNAAGEIEEHFVAEDADRKIDITRMIAEEKKRRDSQKGQTGTVQPLPRVPGDTPRPPRDVDIERNRTRGGGREGGGRGGS